MAIENKINTVTLHDDYTIYSREWVFLRDAMRGNTIIKNKGEFYLPYPSNLPKDVNKSLTDSYYAKFLKLTDFPDLTKQSANSMKGLISSGESTIDNLPSSLDNDSFKNYVINTYHQVMSECLVVGRNGLLIEVVDNVIGLDLKTYTTENIENWHTEDDKIVFAVLRQSVPILKDDGVSYDYDNFNHLILKLVDGVYTQELRNNDFEVIDIITPTFKGTTFDFIPFYILTPTKMNDEVANSPLSPIASLCLHIYRNTAIWNKSIATKGDPTLTLFGFENDELERLSSGANNIIASSNTQASARFLEMDTGTEFIKDKIMFDTQTAQAYAGKLLDTGNSGVESGESLKQRRLTSEISLKSIVTTISKQMTTILQDFTNKYGYDDYLTVVFNGFDEFSAKIQDVDDLLKASGLIINGIVSKKTIHARATELGITDSSFEDEEKDIQAEKDIELS